jgi:hypothetical protein
VFLSTAGPTTTSVFGDSLQIEDEGGKWYGVMVPLREDKHTIEVNSKGILLTAHVKPSGREVQAEGRQSGVRYQIENISKKISGHLVEMILPV